LSDIRQQDNRATINIDLRKDVSLNTNYLRLTNKPSINGVELTGNKTSEELNLLSNNQSEYEQIELESAGDADFLLVLGNENQPKKMKISELSSRTMQTAETMPENLEIGSYIFLLMEDRNGTN